MTFSVGQNFFNDLLQSSDKRTHNDKKAIEQTYLKQKRLNDFWVNNDIPVLVYEVFKSEIIESLQLTKITCPPLVKFFDFKTFSFL